MLLSHCAPSHDGTPRATTAATIHARPTRRRGSTVARWAYSAPASTSTINTLANCEKTSSEKTNAVRWATRCTTSTARAAAQAMRTWRQNCRWPANTLLAAAHTPDQAPSTTSSVSNTPGTAFRYCEVSRASSHDSPSPASSTSATSTAVVPTVRHGNCGSGCSSAIGASARRSVMWVWPRSMGVASGQSKRSPWPCCLRCRRAPLRVSSTSTCTVRGSFTARSMRRCRGATKGSSSTRSQSSARPTVTGQRVMGARASNAPWRSKASISPRVVGIVLMVRPPSGRP
ncbi:hypothetical protein D3C71_1072030 [compost metagenome]